MTITLDPDLAGAFIKMFCYLAKVQSAVEHDTAFRAALVANPLLTEILPRQVLNQAYDLVGDEWLAEIHRVHAPVPAPAAADPATADGIL